MTSTHATPLLVTFGQLRIFGAIAEEGSFSGAASRIGITQSGASQAMTTLEAMLGVRLLARRRDGVVPTEMGRAVLEDAREAMRAVERIRQRCAAAAGLQVGQLRIGSVASAAARLLPGKLAQYRRLYPEVELVLMEGTDREILQWVEGEIVDLGLTSEASAETDSRVVLEDKFVLLVARGHALAGRRRVRLDEIAGEKFLMSGSGCEPAIRALFAEAGVAPSVALTVRDGLALTEMVAQGLGVTLVPELAVPEDGRRFRRIAIDPPGRRRLLAVMPRRVEVLPATEKFLRLLLGRRHDAGGRR